MYIGVVAHTFRVLGLNSYKLNKKSFPNNKIIINYGKNRAVKWGA